jgi:hypothetical protein
MVSCQRVDAGDCDMLNVKVKDDSQSVMLNLLVPSTPTQIGRDFLKN